MSLNRFRFGDAKGVVVTAKNTRDCKAAEALAAGDIVKIKDVDSPITVVEKITADTDTIFGVVAFDTAYANGAKEGEIVNIAYDYSIVKMEASAALAAGADVMAVVEGMKVATATNGKTAFGQACIKAKAGDLVPVMLYAPYELPA